ncbi:MAG: hypothetical protein HYR55_00955 [Acidobacteria bacterium]|nr:hypothetical protein [Acidobacteriota bacterium]
MRCHDPGMEEKVACFNLLSDEEKSLVEFHIRQCPACARDRGLDKEIGDTLRNRRHLAPADIIDYALQKKRMHRTKRLGLESHLKDCPECRAEVWLTQDTEQDFVEPKPSLFPTLRTWRPSPAFSAAIAILLLLLFPYLILKMVRMNRELKEASALHHSQSLEAARLVQEARKASDQVAHLAEKLRGISQPQPAAFLRIRPQDTLRSSRKSGAYGNPKEIRFPANIKWVTLVIPVDPEPPRTYTVQIAQAQGKRWEWQAQPVVEDDQSFATISVQLYEEAFEAGLYTLGIYEQNKQAPLIDNYPIRIIKP